jgi:hypothetical protein
MTHTVCNVHVLLDIDTDSDTDSDSDTVTDDDRGTKRYSVDKKKQ